MGVFQTFLGRQSLFPCSLPPSAFGNITGKGVKGKVFKDLWEDDIVVGRLE